MDEGIPIGMEMESASCICAMRAAQRANEGWCCKKCNSHNHQRDCVCNGCGKSRYRKVKR